MKNYVIGTLVVIIVAMASLIYKIETSPNTKFPISEETEIRSRDTQIPLFLYVFFTKKNCRDCMEFIEVLNELPPQYIVTGIVPESELKEETELRSITRAAFPLESLGKYKKYIPWYAPGTVGVSYKGDILFVLPGVPGEKEYLETFLDSLYGKLYPIFLKEKLSQKK